MGISVLLSCGRRVSSYQAGMEGKGGLAIPVQPADSRPGIPEIRPAEKASPQHLRRLNVRLYQVLPLSPPHTFNQFDPNAQKNSTSSSNIEQIMLKLHFRKADYTVSTAFLFKLLQLQKWQSCILMIRKRFAACRGISDLVETTCIAFWWSAQSGKRQQQTI